MKCLQHLENKAKYLHVDKLQMFFSLNSSKKTGNNSFKNTNTDCSKTLPV